MAGMSPEGGLPPEVAELVNRVTSVGGEGDDGLSVPHHDKCVVSPNHDAGSLRVADWESGGYLEPGQNFSIQARGTTENGWRYAMITEKMLLKSKKQQGEVMKGSIIEVDNKPGCMSVQGVLMMLHNPQSGELFAVRTFRRSAIFNDNRKYQQEQELALMPEHEYVERAERTAALWMTEVWSIDSDDASAENTESAMIEDPELWDTIARITEDVKGKIRTPGHEMYPEGYLNHLKSKSRQAETVDAS